MPLAAGTTVGPYRIDVLLGAGGMGEVYRATDTRLERPVAIKFILQKLTGEDARQRFARETRALSSLNHPHIVTVHETGTFDGRDFLVTEFVDGGTLSHWAKAEKRSWRQIVELLTGVADGLATAHDAGILHRDIKPDNILISTAGYAKLADFGLAKSVDSPGATRTTEVSPTRHGMLVGTLEYLSPEQAMGKPLDARSDIFSFGIVLYELLAGKRPFAGATDLHVVDAVLKTTPQPLGDDIPASLRTLVEKSLEKDPADRYQSMRDLVVDLRRLVRHTGEASSASLKVDVEQRSRGIPLAAVAAAVLVAAMAGGGLWWLAASRAPAGSGAAGPSIRSIAVLPMENLSGNADEDYFSDGMTEELISRLAQVHALRVTSRTSVMRYKRTEKSLPDIARELGVDAIIEGLVRRADGRVRVTAQLIHGSTDAHLWAKDFDRELSNVLRLQSEIADAIVREIKVQVTPEEATRLARKKEVSPVAYDALMRGKFHLSQIGNRDSWKLAISEF